MKWAIKPFQGEIPRAEPYLLPVGHAVLAKDTVLLTGAAKPLRAGTKIADLAKVGVKKTIYRYGQDNDPDEFWFHWTQDVDVTRGPVLDDPNNRVFYTGEGSEPRYTDATIATASASMPSAYRELGIPTPTAATISAGGTADADTTPRTIVLSYSFVTAQGEPGPPAPVSNALSIYPGQTLSVSGLDGVPSGSYDITHKRLWISQTDSDGDTRLRFWQDVLIGASTAGGTEVDFTTLGEAVDDPSLIPPPDDLFGLGLHPNGFLFGFTKRKFCRSEVWRPYGWPSMYQDPIGDDIVGGKIIGQSVVICTKGLTYVATGSDPLNQSIVDLSGTQPCVSKRSIVKMPAGVIYASAEGLVLVSGTAPLNLITYGHFTAEQWRAFAPESMHCAVQDNLLYCWFDTGSATGALIFEFGNSGEIVRVTRSSIYATAAFLDRDGELYVALPGDNDVYRWNAGAALEQVWKSGEIVLDRPQAIRAARVRGEFPIVFEAWGDGALLCSLDIRDPAAFRFRCPDRLRKFQVQVRSRGKIEEVEFATSIGELRRSDG